MPDGSATAHRYLPKLYTTLTGGYGAAHFRKDALAGLTVAIVALPLSMAIGVASGVPPERALYAAIIGGFLVSVLGGSRFQIGGPAGAFIVLVGLSGLGTLIRHIPHAVTVGFSAGIAVTIFASQLRDLAGLSLEGAEPGHIFPKLAVLAAAIPTANLSALALGVGSAALIFALRRWRPMWPGMLIAIVAASVAASILHLPVETIGSRFGGLPSGLPWPHLPSATWSRLVELLPTALSFTLLGGVESLLSAKIADSMTKRKHRSNMELLAQGVANVVSALFGGISVTGTIARTATNIRAGAVSPISGILHSAFLLAFILVAAPLANAIPLAALAGLLVVVCWNMAEKEEFVHLLRHGATATVLLLTFGLTIVFDLTVGIIAGCLAAALLAVLRPNSDPHSNRDE
jgi:SulP family sulfate permease